MRRFCHISLLLFAAGCATQEPAHLGAGPVRPFAAAPAGGTEPAALAGPGDLAQLQWSYLEARRAYMKASQDVDRAAARYERRLRSLADAAGNVSPGDLDFTPSTRDLEDLKRTAQRYEALGRNYQRAERQYARAVRRQEKAATNLETAKARYEEALKARQPDDEAVSHTPGTGMD